MYQSPLSRLGKQRLQILRRTNDGFVIAEKDLEIRGPGALLGTRQTGLIQMRIADLDRDSHMLDAVKSAAAILFSDHPQVIEPLISRWVADNEQYAQV